MRHHWLIRMGTVQITLTVSDNLSTSSSTITVVVNSVNDRPTITAAQVNAQTSESTPIVLGFTIDDVDDNISGLLVTGASSDVGFGTKW